MTFLPSILLAEYGEDATVHAAMRADAIFEQGDMEGYAVWKTIVKAVEELLNTEAETVH